MATKPSLKKQYAYVVVIVKVDGSHNWPTAPDEVAFLRLKHVHQFTIKCVKEVKQLDRETEFYMFKRELNYFLSHYNRDSLGIVQFEDSSCEMIAMEFVEKFGLFACEVMEDDQFGGIFQEVTE